MKPRLLASAAISAAVSALLAGCGGDGDCIDCGVVPPQATTSYLGSGGSTIAAWADPTTQTLDVAPLGQYGGKRQIQRGTVSPYTGNDVGQPAGAEIYEFADGYIHELDLTDVGFPVAAQVSTESNATIDPGCTETGKNAVAGATYDYQGVFFAGDLSAPQNSTYIYRLPGADGVCNTSDDVIHAVRTGMSPTDPYLVASVMPAATYFSAGGAITGFVGKSGNTIVLTDANVATPATLATYASPIGVLDALPVGAVSGYETNRLFVVDGDIVSIDYANKTVSDSLFTIPNWTNTDDHLVTAASPDMLYFSTYTPGVGGAPGSSDIYGMPADGSAAPTLMSTQVGHVTQLAFPVGSSNLVVGIEDGTTYSIVAMPAAGGLATTVMMGTETSGRFTATATDVYWTEWNVTNTGSAITRTGTMSGISAMDGTVVMAAVANSMFMNGGEATPWAVGDVLTQRTSLETVFQVTNLHPVTVTANGVTYTADGISGGTLNSIDTASNTMIVAVGTFPTSTATLLEGTIHSSFGHWMFIEASTLASTQDPATRDLYLLNSNTAGSLVRATTSL